MMTWRVWNSRSRNWRGQGLYRYDLYTICHAHHLLSFREQIVSHCGRGTVGGLWGLLATAEEAADEVKDHDLEQHRTSDLPPRGPWLCSLLLACPFLRGGWHLFLVTTSLWRHHDHASSVKQFFFNIFWKHVLWAYAYLEDSSWSHSALRANLQLENQVHSSWNKYDVIWILWYMLSK